MSDSTTRGSAAPRVTVDKNGVVRVEADTEGMFAPFRCEWCGCVHDAGKVTVLARYTDCSVWACPGCGVKIDDRPRAWGGRATDLRAEARRG